MQGSILGQDDPLKEEVATHSSIFCQENPINSMKRQTDITPEDEPSVSEGVQYAPEEEPRAITNSSRKNEVSGPKQK